MKKILIYMVLALVVVGCKNNKIDRPPKPDNLLSEEKMVEVIYDMTIMSAAKGLNRRIIENRGVNPESFVYDKHSIDSVQFALSNQYYAYDIDLYEDIYMRVKTKLEADKVKFKAELDKKATDADSVSRTNQIRRDSIIQAKSQELKLDLD
ncbi:MAG: DUF4296 domain-containing protein [Flavobacteriaceae bacterium]|nr:DUF4296 domain-containing protein [Bacteroidia bacterium]NNF73992.1 DUF4296 domain-containing protein [Flavobacteriaceae bacterium]NNK72858.1 DUF4296 domain-containing protein [Flavobacteriaceae bacterium]